MNGPSIDRSGAGRGTFSSYATGSVLSIVLTGIPFVLVMQGMLSRQTTLVAVAGAAAIQVIVQLYCFLHLDASSRARRYFLVMLFALLIIFFIVGGTIWIMHHLNYRLM